MTADQPFLSGHGRTVCVTGAGGFIASWIVKLLLEKGYTVKGTVRKPDDPKNNHLKTMEGAEKGLTLYQADLLDLESLRSAIRGCDGVFHTASPVTDDPELMVEPAVKGTQNVINAAADAGVGRVVFTSSIGAVTMDPNRGPDVVVDESCWSDLDFCKKTKNWYCYGKAVAEAAAWEVAAERGIELAVINPVLVLGPLLQPSLNVSATHILKYLDGSAKKYANAVQAYVDVRDVAVAHVLVFEAPEAKGNRYLCAESVLHRGDIVRILEKLFPNYPIPTKKKPLPPSLPISSIDEINPTRPSPASPSSKTASPSDFMSFSSVLEQPSSDCQRTTTPSLPSASTPAIFPSQQRPLDSSHGRTPPCV